jgi:CMP-N,N'-diacetyllegionaminic acid synthase
MYNNKKIVAIIPARGGSKGIPRKNVKILNGHPLISYSIKAANNSKYIDECYVSTDDDEIFNTSLKYGSKAIKRPDEFATDIASSESVLLHFAQSVDFDILVFLQCTSPLTHSTDLDNAIEKYFDNNLDTLLSVCEDHGGFLCGGFTWDEKLNPINHDGKRLLRQQIKKKYYRENGAFYIMSKKGLLEHKNRFHGRQGFYEISRWRSFELDEVEDFEFIEQILKNKIMINLINTE